MTAWPILRRAALAGVHLEAAGSELRVIGPDHAVAELVPLLRQHKAELLALLEARAKINRDPPDNDEVERMMRRMARARALGFDEDEAEQLADCLLIRDREFDDRRCCTECKFADAAGAVVACSARREMLRKPMALELKRCGHFRPS